MRWCVHERALRNVLALARQMKRRARLDDDLSKEADADCLIRFCAKAGVVPRILRKAEPTPAPKAGGR